MVQWWYLGAIRQHGQFIFSSVRKLAAVVDKGLVLIDEFINHIPEPGAGQRETLLKLHFRVKDKVQQIAIVFP